MSRLRPLPPLHRLAPQVFYGWFVAVGCGQLRQGESLLFSRHDVDRVFKTNALDFCEHPQGGTELSRPVNHLELVLPFRERHGQTTLLAGKLSPFFLVYPHFKNGKRLSQPTRSFYR